MRIFDQFALIHRVMKPGREVTFDPVPISDIRELYFQEGALQADENYRAAQAAALKGRGGTVMSHLPSFYVSLLSYYLDNIVEKRITEINPFVHDFFATLIESVTHDIDELGPLYRDKFRYDVRRFNTIRKKFMAA